MSRKGLGEWLDRAVCDGSRILDEPLNLVWDAAVKLGESRSAAEDLECKRLLVQRAYRLVLRAQEHRRTTRTEAQKRKLGVTQIPKEQNDG